MPQTASNEPQEKGKTPPPIPDDDLSIFDILKLVTNAIEEKKGENPVSLDLIDSVDYLDYLVICNGQTAIHNRAIADNIEKALSNYDIIPDGLYGRNHGEWIVVDYGVVVVHVFLQELRDFYQLEDLWASGNLVVLE